MIDYMKFQLDSVICCTFKPKLGRKGQPCAENRCHYRVQRSRMYCHLKHYGTLVLPNTDRSYVILQQLTLNLALKSSPVQRTLFENLGIETTYRKPREQHPMKIVLRMYLHEIELNSLFIMAVGSTETRMLRHK